MNWHKLLERLEGAYAPSTINSYRTDFGKFADWCRRKRLSALPAKPETVARYIDAHAPTAAVSSIKREICAVKKIHRLAGHDGVAEAEDVLLALRRARRAKPGRPKQALGITYERRCALMAASSNDLAGLRDRVLVAIGFDSLCRRSEIVAFRIEDLTPGEDGAMSVLVRRAKNDPFGLGRTAHVSVETSELVKAWLSSTGATHGPLLRPVYGTKVHSRYLEPASVARILKQLARRAYDSQIADRVSGHSLRVGAAQYLTARGVGLLPIMSAGGWKSVNVVARYVENVDQNLWQ